MLMECPTRVSLAREARMRSEAPASVLRAHLGPFPMGACPALAALPTPIRPVGPLSALPTRVTTPMLGALSSHAALEGAHLLRPILSALPAAPLSAAGVEHTGSPAPRWQAVPSVLSASMATAQPPPVSHVLLALSPTRLAPASAQPVPLGLIPSQAPVRVFSLPLLANSSLSLPTPL